MLNRYDVTTSLVAAGACEVVAVAMRLHPSDVQLQQQYVLLILKLLLNVDARSRLGGAGTCASLMEAARLSSNGDLPR